MTRLISFSYYGGKNSQLGWLLPLLPYSKRYIEPFAGSAAALLNRERSPVEVYNDLNEEVVNFFRVLREQKSELIDLLYLTPYSRAAFKEALLPSDEPLERARKWFVKARQSFMGNTRTWSTSFNIRAGWSQMISRWLGGIEKLEEVATRISGVILECRTAIEVIKTYDCKETVMYLDPPYPLESRTSKKAYHHEMQDEEHEELLHLIKSCDSDIAISSYHNALYDEELKEWFVYEDKLKQLAGPRGMRQEVVWMNYDYRENKAPDQTTLSDFS